MVNKSIVASLMLNKNMQYFTTETNKASEVLLTFSKTVRSSNLQEKEVWQGQGKKRKAVIK